METVIAYVCMCAIGAGIVYGALEWLIKEIRFELVGRKRRRAIARLMEQRKEQR